MNALMPCRMRGQAFSEMLVAVLFLVPLLLCIVYLVNLMRAEQGAEDAAHQIALAMIHAPSGIIDDALVQRLQELAIPADDSVGERLPAQVATTALPNAATDVETIARRMLLPAALVGVGDFDLPEFLPRRATTGISMGSTRELGVPFDLPIVVQAEVAFIAGHGAARSPDEVRSQTAALSVAGALAEVSEPLQFLASIASLLEPALRRLCIGRIDPEVVPADRLPDALTRSSDLRYQPC